MRFVSEGGIVLKESFMFKKLSVTGLIAISLSGCSSPVMGLAGTDANVVYSAHNRNPHKVQQVRVMDASDPNTWYFSQSSQPAFIWRPSSPSARMRNVAGIGGHRFDADSAHRVPDQVQVTWRDMPEPGAKDYTGKLHGPYTVKVRSEIPAQYLRQAGDPDHVMGISILFNEGGARLNWKLIHMLPLGESKTIAEGGDTYPW